MANGREQTFHELKNRLSSPRRFFKPLYFRLLNDGCEYLGLVAVWQIVADPVRLKNPVELGSVSREPAI